jgi:predicted nucleic acid-binding protein
VKPVFGDTFYWIALLNADDSAHERAAAFDISLTRPPIITTQETLIEFLTFFSGRGPRFRIKAVAVAHSLTLNQGVRIFPQTHETYSAGVAFYASRPDKGYSLTDCISMQTMWREQVTDVLTNDRHFEQEGFRPLFRS